jgi:glucose/arabinose dehydrogenase
MLVAALAVIVLLAASFGPFSDQGSAYRNPATRTIVAVSGAERLAWDQAAETLADLEALEFLIFVDNAAVVAEGVECASERTPDEFSCTAPLPAMSEGRHLIEVAARLPGTTHEGPRSDPIEVIVGAGAVFKVPPKSAAAVTREGVHLRTKVRAAGIEDATDMVSVAGGVILIAERAGRILMFRNGDVSLPVADAIEDVDTSAPGSGLLAIAATRTEPLSVFALHTTRKGARLIRYTYRAGRLTARGTLLDGLPIARENPRASMRVGPDGMLYVALDDAGDGNRVGDMGSLSGKILRLNLDGTTPADAKAPVYAVGASRPLALAWSTDGLVFSVLSAGIDEFGQVTERKGAAVKRFSLPAGSPAVAMWRYDGNAISGWNGDLLIAREQSLQRLTSDGDGMIAGSELLFDGQLEDVRALTSDSNGNLFLISRGHLFHVVADDRK